MRPSQAARHYEGNAEKARGLESLDDACDLVKIKGEGHCLFRAMAAGILYRYTQLDEQGKQVFIERLFHIRGELARGIPEESWSRFTNAFLDCPDPRKALEAMNDHTLSNEMVRIMRTIAVERLRRAQVNPHDTFSSVFEHTATELPMITPEYLRDMEDFSKNMYGSDVEKSALQDVFSLDVPLYPVSSLGQPRSPAVISLGQTSFGLIFDCDRDGSNGHYNLAIPRSLPRT